MCGPGGRRSSCHHFQSGGVAPFVPERRGLLPMEGGSR